MLSSVCHRDIRYDLFKSCMIKVESCKKPLSDMNKNNGIHMEIMQCKSLQTMYKWHKQKSRLKCMITYGNLYHLKIIHT